MRYFGVLFLILCFCSCKDRDTKASPSEDRPPKGAADQQGGSSATQEGGGVASPSPQSDSSGNKNQMPGDQTVLPSPSADLTFFTITHPVPHRGLWIKVVRGDGQVKELRLINRGRKDENPCVLLTAEDFSPHLSIRVNVHAKYFSQSTDWRVQDLCQKENCNLKPSHYRYHVKNPDDSEDLGSLLPSSEGVKLSSKCTSLQ